jgi:hypothetical protein
VSPDLAYWLALVVKPVVFTSLILILPPRVGGPPP